MLKAPYKGPSGQWYTKSLFLEPTQQTGVVERQDFKPIFSLMGKDGYIDARETFVQLEDPTGYKWSQLYLKSWDHFEFLKRAQWFRDQLEEWGREIDARIKSKALDKIKAIASDPDAPQAQVMAAAKYLADGSYKPSSKPGRPSKEAVAGELKAAMKQATIEDDDAKRIGLRVVK